MPSWALPVSGSNFTVNIQDPKEGIQQQHATIQAYNLHACAHTHRLPRWCFAIGDSVQQKLPTLKFIAAPTSAFLGYISPAVYSGYSRKCDWTLSVSQNTQMCRRPCYPSLHSYFRDAVFSVGNVAGLQKDDLVWIFHRR